MGASEATLGRTAATRIGSGKTAAADQHQRVLDAIASANCSQFVLDRLETLEPEAVQHKKNELTGLGLTCGFGSLLASTVESGFSTVYSCRSKDHGIAGCLIPSFSGAIVFFGSFVGTLTGLICLVKFDRTRFSKKVARSDKDLLSKFNRAEDRLGLDNFFDAYFKMSNAQKSNLKERIRGEQIPGERRDEPVSIPELPRES